MIAQRGNIASLCKKHLAATRHHVWGLLGLISSAGVGLQGGVAIATDKQRQFNVDDVSHAQFSSRDVQTTSLKSSLDISSQIPPVNSPLTKLIAELQIKSDRQSYSPIKKIFVAEGKAEAFISGYRLKADRIEFDNVLKIIYAKGRVRFEKGNQYFQASSLRYDLNNLSGELIDVYGTIDLKNLVEDLNFDIKSSINSPSKKEQVEIDNKKISSIYFKYEGDKDSINKQKLISKNNYVGETIDEKNLNDNRLQDSISCPPPLPPIPNWHPYPWALTFWGGQMTDAKFGETFFFKGQNRQEYLMGIGINKRFYRSGPFALEIEADFFRHNAHKQLGGKYNQDVPYSNVDQQIFGEYILGIVARFWVQPWLSFGITEGFSYYNSISNYERTHRDKFNNLLNYLGLEVQAELSDKLSLVGRIHHRSGVYGTYGGAEEGSNAYIIGLRYHWGIDKNSYKSSSFSAPIGCADSKGIQDIEKHTSLEKELTELRDPNFRKSRLVINNKNIYPEKVNNKVEGRKNIFKNFNILRRSSLLSRQELIRRKAIKTVDQRITNLRSNNNIVFEGRLGIPNFSRDMNEKSRLSGIGISKLNKRLITGSVRRWRIQSKSLVFNQNGWSSEKISFTNDPLTPSQSRIEAEDVTGIEEDSGDILIRSRKSRLIFEDRLSIPFKKNQRIKEKSDLENRWVIGIDNKDRDGLFIGRQLVPWKFGANYELFLQPQFLIQRAINGKTNSYVGPGKSDNSQKISSSTSISDLFGLKAELNANVYGWDLNSKTDISTFNIKRFNKGTRLWNTMGKKYYLPWIEDVDFSLFGAFRYRVWNGSLGNTDIYSAYGGLIEKKNSFKYGKFDNNYLVRMGIGNYRAELVKSGEISSLWRGNIYGSLDSNYPIWKGRERNQDTYTSYIYSPRKIIPGLYFNTNLRATYALYANGKTQNAITFRAGPSLTLGNFTKPYFDYTKISVFSSRTIKNGDSPFNFDRAVDLGTISFGITQQIAGPLVFKTGLEYNIDKDSQYYGKRINSSYEIKWLRRSYDIGLFYRPNEGVGGMTIRFNDFDFKGRGLPFVPLSD